MHIYTCDHGDHGVKDHGDHGVKDHGDHVIMV